VDLCQKVRAAGYRNYYVPQAVVVHHGGSSSKESASTFAAVMMPEATLRFLRKTRGRGYAGCYRLAMFAAAFARLSALSLAVFVAGGRNSSTRSSLRKWRAVLRWAAGRDELVKKYYPNATG
jgi:GT2 family glycosyltransferase